MTSSYSGLWSKTGVALRCAVLVWAVNTGVGLGFYYCSIISFACAKALSKIATSLLTSASGALK